MSDDASADLIRSIIENMKGADPAWTMLSMIVSLGGGRLSGTYGYAYSPDGTISAVASRPSGIRPDVHAYLDSEFPDDAARPVKMLVQFDRTSSEYAITFEDTDSSRWQVTPANIDAIREELRPDFG